MARLLMSALIRDAHAAARSAPLPFLFRYVAP